MSDLMFCTEKEVKDILIDVAKSTDEAPFVFVAFREQSPRSFARKVTFVIQTKEGNETLVNNVIKASMKYERVFTFVKSDVNIQSGNYAVDFIMVEATITPQLA